MENPDNRISVIKGDITTLDVDAIVNAANNSLMGGGGVDGAIHKAGGSEIMEECIRIRNSQGGCATGCAVITTAGRLKARYVIHTVGPVWNGGNRNEEKLLESCYFSCLKLAVENNIKTVAFPNISTGVYRYPKELAVRVAVNTVESFLKEDGYIEKVIFVCFDDTNLSLYQKLLETK